MNQIAMLALISLFALSGCAEMRERTMPPEKNLLSGAGIIMQRENAEQIDVEKLIKEMDLANATVIEKEGPVSEMWKYRRNELQSKLIMASNQRCGLYLREITAAKAQTNMAWGGLSLLLTGAATVVTHVPTVKALAAGAGAATATNALYDQSYFNNLAVGVISAGIAKQREGILIQMGNKSKMSLVEYPVHRAVADALQYHSACNVISGLETAAVATKLAPTQPRVDSSVPPATPPVAPPVAPPQVAPQI
ncbi:hypothetical protein [Massilia sp. TSP1-1-2]|uniref:hypothetical protein n=1 Tax=Massilia sp. TSP1-1-2 TaxID=2804649 RepID=UPI003CE9C350